MKKSDVKIGGRYEAKVSGQIVPIIIRSEHQRKGWNAINQKTGRFIHIKSAQRLRRTISIPEPTTIAKSFREFVALNGVDFSRFQKRKYEQDPVYRELLRKWQDLQDSNPSPKRRPKKQAHSPSGAPLPRTIEELIEILAESKDPAERRVVRRELRKLGHRGGLRIA